MASVSSLDKDMRNIRLSKYTPQAANEVRTWIEDVLGERLAAGDLLEALKDGIALCKYAGPCYNVSSSPDADEISQARQPCCPTRCALQRFLYALRSNGEHLPLSPRVSITSIEFTIPRYLPDRGPL